MCNRREFVRGRTLFGFDARLSLRPVTRLLVTFALLAWSGSFARGAEAGERRQSLDGPWQFTTDAAAVEQADAKWDAITVPGNWDTLPAYSTYKGKGWYRREFTAPDDWKGKRVRLKFDAVYHDATVTLNGKELGSHNGGYTPFEFDVTDTIKLGAKNTVTVCADNTYRRGAWWHWGGISRSVTLLANNDARIVWQHVRTEPDLAAGTAKIFVSYKLANAGNSPLKVSVASAINLWSREGVGRVQRQRVGVETTLAPHSEGLCETSLVLPKGTVRLWDFDHPNLYQIATQLLVAGKVVHGQRDRFGIRKIELTKDSLLLNGERVRLCGFNRVSDSREFGNTEPDALVKKDVDLMKRANANLSRLMHYPQAPNLLDYLDEKGMLIWCEIPIWGGDDPFIKATDLSLPRQWMTEMIERDYNHPCIIGWSVGNELRNHFNYVRDMVEFTRGLDPHRIVTHVSNSGAGAKVNPSSDPLSISPVILYNTYTHNKSAAAVLHERWPDKPVFYSEFGIKQFGGNLDAQIEGLEQMYQLATAGNPYMIGTSLWTYNDYRSDFQGTPPSGNREWGVVDEQRRPKAAYEQVRKLYSPVHSLSAAKGEVRVEPRSADEVPSFTLRGYKLKWDGGETALPDLKPGAPAWAGRINAKQGAVIRLVTPTGYDVADCAMEP